MSDLEVQPGPESTGGLTQMQRVTNTFVAPSRTFEDIKRGNLSWWMPFLITLLAGAFLYGAITKEVTWRGVFENQQRNAPQFAKKMMEDLTPEQRAVQEAKGPINQAVTWALSPLGLLLMDVVAAAILMATINFGFGGRAKFGAVLAVTLYAGLVLWPIRLVLGGLALLAGQDPGAFNLQNVAGTNIGYYLSKQDTPAVLYALATGIDPLVIWNLALTGIGLAIVAGTNRKSGYIAVFGWWVVVLILVVGMAAMMG